MDQSNNDIKKLIKGCKQQKRVAQKGLYKHFYSYAMSVCLRYSNSREDAVEIMNDAFFKVFKYIHGFNSDRPFKPWLRKILINGAIDHVNRNSEIKTAELELIKNQENISDQEYASVSYNDLLEIIKKLPPAYRTVFNLRAIEGYKHEEIARILGISEGTSKSNYSKARAKLQEYLSIYFGVKQ